MTAYSILDLVMISEGRTSSDAIQSSLELAQAADAIASSSPPLLIGHIAGATKRIRVGSGGIMLPNHSPLVVAEQFGTLASIYPDRIDLGLGRAPGTDGATADAISPNRMKATYEFPNSIAEIQQYFSDDNIDAKVRAPIAEGQEVPIYILGSSTDSAHLAAAKGLPYAFASHFATAQLFPALDIYRKEFQPSEFLDKPYTMAGVNVIIADTDEEAERLFTTLIRAIIGIITNRRGYLQPPTELDAELQAALQHPALIQFLKYAFVGSKETVKRKTKGFIEQTGVDELIVAGAIYDADARIRSYEAFAEIMKEINGEQIQMSNTNSSIKAEIR